MTVTCPDGHLSTTTDYCDHCGTRLDIPVEPAARPSAVDEPQTAPAGAPEQCPGCGTPRSGADRFCEECGHDFMAGSESAGPTATVWEAVVSADRQRFERYASAGLVLPAACPEQRFQLEQARVDIGRSRPGAGGGRPDIDLGAGFEDLAISRLHAALLRQADGSYAVVDFASTNGTTVNDDPKPIDAHVPVPLADGDCVRLGAWTTVTIRRRDATQKSCGASKPASSTFAAS
jgi:hypothetical protein